MLALLLAAALSQTRDEDRIPQSTCGFAFVYLARHQAPDGSWGEASGTCTCPFDPVPPDDRQRGEIAAQLALLEDDQFEVRHRAQRTLWTLGTAAIPDVQAASVRGDPETRYRCLELLKERHRFHSSGDRKTTALVLLSILWQSYTPQSGEVYRRVAIGPMVRKGLQWLRESVPSASDPLSDVLSALALSEAASLTGASLLEDSARLAFERIAPSICDDTEFLAWKAMLLRSASRSWRQREVFAELARIRAALEDRPEPLARYALYLCDVWRGAVPDVLDAAGALAVSPLDLDPTTLLFGTLVFRQVLGRKAIDESWLDADVRRELLMTQRVRGAPCVEGAWLRPTAASTFRKTAMLSMTLGIYYRYVASPGEWDPATP